MEGITLIDVGRSWIYNTKKRGDNKWEPREIVAIVRVFPRFTSMPSQDSNKWVEFCSSELLLYKPFHDIERDIGDGDATIVANWESLHYTPWHVEQAKPIENDEVTSDLDIEDIVCAQENTTTHINGKSHLDCILVNICKFLKQTCWEEENLIGIQTVCLISMRRECKLSISFLK